MSMQMGACTLKVWLQQPTQQAQPPTAGHSQPSKTQDKPQSARQQSRQQRGRERARAYQLSLKYQQLATCRLRIVLLKAMKAIRFRRMWDVAGPALQADIARSTVAQICDLVQQVSAAAGGAASQVACNG